MIDICGATMSMEMSIAPSGTRRDFWQDVNEVKYARM